MQAIFNEIVAGDFDAVAARVQEKASVVALVASGSPKKFAGQSTLQVAIRSSQFAIADFLIEQGADVNFVDVKSPSGWAKPVLFDALAAAVGLARCAVRILQPASDEVWRIGSTAELSNAAFATLVKLLDAGATVQTTDSFGGSPLSRAARAAEDVLPRYKLDDPAAVDEPPLPQVVVDDLGRIFDALLSRGADPNAVDAQLNMSLADYYRQSLVSRFWTGAVDSGK